MSPRIRRLKQPMRKPNIFLQDGNCTATLTILEKKVPKRRLPLRIKKCSRAPLETAQRPIPVCVRLFVSRRFPLSIRCNSNTVGILPRSSTSRPYGCSALGMPQSGVQLDDALSIFFTATCWNESVWEALIDGSLLQKLQ